MSGGHLERDSFFFNKLNKNSISTQIVQKMREFNQRRKILLSQAIKKIIKKKLIKILIIGISYKKNSFSLTNTIFSNIFKNKKFSTSFFDDQFKKVQIKKVHYVKKLNYMDKFDLIIYNYSSVKNAEIIKKYMKKNLTKNLINISSEKKKFKGRNIHSIF